MLDERGGKSPVAADGAPSRAPAESSAIVMTADEIITLISRRVFDAIQDIYISQKIIREIKTAIQSAVTKLSGENPTASGKFINTTDFDIFVTTAMAHIVNSLRHEGISKLHAALRRLEVSNAIEGRLGEAPLAALSVSELTHLAIKAYRANEFRLETQFRRELLRRPNLPIDEIILDLTYLISAHERLSDTAHALALAEILLEYLETQVTDEQVTLKSGRGILIERTRMRIERFKKELSAAQS